MRIILTQTEADEAIRAYLESRGLKAVHKTVVYNVEGKVLTVTCDVEPTNRDQKLPPYRD